MSQLTFAQRAAALADSKAKVLQDHRAAVIQKCWQQIEEFVNQNAEKGLYSADMDLTEIFKVLPYNLFEKGMEERGLQYLARGRSRWSSLYKIYWR